MHKVYINAASICVNNLSLPNSPENWVKVDLPKIDSKILSPNSARRMSKAVKMGIISAMEALQQIDRSELVFKNVLGEGNYGRVLNFGILIL